LRGPNGEIPQRLKTLLAAVCLDRRGALPAVPLSTGESPALALSATLWFCLMRKTFLYVCLALIVVAAVCGCGEKKTAANVAERKQNGGVPEMPELPDGGPLPKPSLDLAVKGERYKGDLDGMAKRRRIRALVVYSPTGFFYDKGHPKGISYEAVEEFQRFLNKKLRTRTLKIYVTFIPVKPEQLGPALLQGVGDLIATGAIVTPERERQFDFTAPIATGIEQVVVTGPTGAAIEKIEDLSGKEVYASPTTNYYENLESVSNSLKKNGQPPILLKAAEPHLTDEDLLEMVSAGLIPATVTFRQRAEFWAKVLPHLMIQRPILAGGGQLAWVTRDDSPKLKALLDEFIESHRLGTSFGNTLFRRYLQNTKWVTNSTASSEMRKFQTYVSLFQKYARRYDFDFLLLTAMGYQESKLDQGRRSPQGAVGIMQVIPEYAAAPPISIPSVADADSNIHAGAKILHHIAQTYFDDPSLDLTDKTLMTFAAYNAGPTRISRLRRRAKEEGLDPNQWFGNVELVVAKDVGQETVHFVSNIYKYYIAYKLTSERHAT
jgi:membrane-bound lytic murein transglycosylase MltF